VDLGLEVTGGNGIFRSAGYERLVRDARLGRIHPANSFLTHEVVAQTVLGISLDEQPRWAGEFSCFPLYSRLRRISR
jgi:alkylation response protein AidB-like acyl-CoA dehydrogenase